MGFTPAQIKGKIKSVEEDEQLRALWLSYQKKYPYAADMDYAGVIGGVRELLQFV